MTDSADDRQAYLAFPISRELRERIAEIALSIRGSEDPSEHVPELVELIVDLTNQGLGHYFLHPLEVAGVGMMSLATAKIGIASAGKGIPMVVRRVIRSASDEELLALVDFMEELVVETPAPEPSE